MKVAAILPLTGEASKYGEDALNGMRLAQEHLKAKGIDVPELVIGDSKGEPKTAVTVYQQLKAANNIRACISMLSGVSKAIAPIAARDGVFHFATVAAAPNIFSSEDPAFRWYYSGDLLATKMAQLIAERGGISRVAILAENIDYSSAGSARLSQLLSQASVSVSSEIYDAKNLAARDVVAKSLVPKPDLVVLLGSGGRAAANLLSSLREQGFKGLILSDDSVSFPEVLTAASEAARGVAFVASSFDGKELGNPFVKAYTERYGKPPSDIAAFAYDMLKILAAQVHAADGKAIAAAIAGMTDYDSVVGKVSAIPAQKNISVPLRLRLIEDPAATGGYRILDALP